MSEPFSFEFNDLDLSLSFQTPPAASTSLDGIARNHQVLIHADASSQVSSSIPSDGPASAFPPALNHLPTSFSSSSFRLHSPLMTSSSLNFSNLSPNASATSPNRSFHSKSSSYSNSPSPHSKSPSQQNISSHAKSPSQPNIHNPLHNHLPIEKPVKRFSTIISSIFSKKRNTPSNPNPNSNSNPDTSRHLAPAANISPNPRSKNSSVSEISNNLPVFSSTIHNTQTPLTVSSALSPSTSSFSGSPGSISSIASTAVENTTAIPASTTTPPNNTKHITSTPNDTTTTTPTTNASSSIIQPSHQNTHLVPNSLHVASTTFHPQNQHLNHTTPISIPDPSSMAPLSNIPSQISPPIPASLSLLADPSIDQILPPVPPISSIYTPSTSSSSSPNNSHIDSSSRRSSISSFRKPSLSGIFSKDSASSDSSLPSAHLTSFSKPHTHLPSLRLRRSNSSIISASKKNKKGLHQSTQNSSDSRTDSQSFQQYNHSFTSSDGTASPMSVFGKPLTPCLTSSSLAVAVANVANSTSFQSFASLSSLSSHALQSDKHKHLHNNTSVFAKDEFHDEFKHLDSDFNKFSSKSGVTKANILRLSLLTFLRKQTGDSSTESDDPNDQPSMENSASSKKNTKSFQRGKLSPADLTKRAKIFQKWWNGILDALKSRDHPVAGSDRSAYLEAISGIMSRFEWIELCYENVPLPPVQPPTTYDTPGYAASFKSTNSFSSFVSYAAAAVNYTSSNEDNASTTSSPRFGPQPAPSCPPQSSFQSNKIYEKLLFETLSWTLNKLALKTVPIAISAFAGKVIAYSFFFAPGVAAPILYLLRVSPLLVDRIVNISFQDFIHEQNNKPIPTSTSNLATLEYSINQMRHFFPAHVSHLVGYTYSSTSSTENKTPNYATAKHQPDSFKNIPKEAFSSEIPSNKPKARMPFSKKSVTNVFPTRPPSPQQLSAIGGDIYGPWVRRWTAFNSDVFHSFLKHYYTLLSKIMTAVARTSAQKAALANTAAMMASTSHNSYYFDKKYSSSSGLNNINSSQVINPQQFARNVHLAAPGLIIIHAYVLGGLDSVIHPPTRPSSGPKAATQYPPSTPPTTGYPRSVSPPLSSRNRSSSGSNLRIAALTTNNNSLPANLTRHGSNLNITPPDGIDFLPNSYAVNLAPVTVGRRRVDQLKILGVVREILHNDDACTPYFEPYCTQLEKMLHALAFRTNLYDIDSCVVLCDLVEEFLSSLVLCSSSRTRHRVAIQKDTAVDWDFWIRVVQLMLASENSNTELRALAFLFNVWDHIPIASSANIKQPSNPVSFSKQLLSRGNTDGSSSSRVKESIFDLYFDEQEGLRWNCAVWLLSPQMWKRYFCHWHPLVRAYFLRLLCWRVASVGSDSDFLTSILFANYNADVRHLLTQRLNYTFHRFSELSQVSMLMQRPMPSAAPCLPVLHRQLKIVYNPASASKPSHTSSIPMIYNDDGNSHHELGNENMGNNKNNQRHGAPSPMPGKPPNPMIRSAQPRRIDPYEVFDDVAYSYPTVAQAPDLLPNINGRGSGNMFGSNGSSNVHPADTKSSGTLSSMASSVGLKQKKKSVKNGLQKTKSKTFSEHPDRSLSTDHFDNDSSLSTKPLTTRTVSMPRISQAKPLSSGGTTRTQSMPRITDKRPLSNDSSNTSTFSIESSTLEVTDTEIDSSGTQQSNLKHASSIRKRWDSFKIGRKSGLRKYFGNNFSTEPVLTEGEVFQEDIVIEEPSFSKGLDLETENISIPEPKLDSLKKYDTTELNGKRSPDSTYSQFFDALEPPSPVVFSFPQSSEDEDSDANNAKPPTTTEATSSYSPTSAFSSTSQASSTFSSLGETPLSSSSSASTPPSPVSICHQKNSSIPSSTSNRSLKSTSGSSEKFSRKFSRRGIFHSNGSTGKSDQSMLDQPLPPLPPQHQQLEIQSQYLLSLSGDTKNDHLFRENSDRNGSSELTKSKRINSYSNVTTLGNSRLEKKLHIHSSGAKSASSSSTNLHSISVDDSQKSENSTTSLIPAPPQILRKRPDIVRPLYKFLLEQCEGSIHRQQELIHAKRYSMHQQYSNGNCNNGISISVASSGAYLNNGYNSGSNLASLNGNNSYDYYAHHTKGYFVFQQRNQGGVGIGSVVSDCYVARPKLPFDVDEDDETNDRQNNQFDPKRQSFNKYLKYNTSLNSVSDFECHALNIVGVRLSDLMRKDGIFQGALEIVDCLSANFDDVSNAHITRNGSFKTLTQFQRRSETGKRSHPYSFSSTLKNANQHCFGPEYHASNKADMSGYSSVPAITVDNNADNSKQSSQIQKQDPVTLSPEVDIHDILGHYSDSSSSLLLQSADSSADTGIFKHSSFDSSNAVTTTTLVLPRDDDSDAASLSTPTADCFHKSYNDSLGIGSPESATNLPSCTSSPAELQQRLSTSIIPSNGLGDSYVSVPSSYSGPSLMSSTTRDSVASTCTVGTRISNSSISYPLVLEDTLTKATALTDTSLKSGRPQHAFRLLSDSSSPTLTPVVDRLNVLGTDTVLDPETTPTPSTAFMSDPFEVVGSKMAPSNSVNSFNSLLSVDNEPNTVNKTNGSGIPLSNPSGSSPHRVTSIHIDEDEDDDDEAVCEFECHNLENPRARIAAKVRDNDKFWKYAGRALNEWHLIVREFSDFVQMRKAAPYGVVKLEDLEVPFLIAEIPSKALVG